MRYTKRPMHYIVIMDCHEVAQFHWEGDAIAYCLAESKQRPHALFTYLEKKTGRTVEYIAGCREVAA